MKKIPLTQGYEAIVDDEDFEWLNQWKWHIFRNKGKIYAIRSTSKGGYKNYLMHREILKAKTGDIIDHIDGEEGLDNRKANLRFCSRAENSMNRSKSKNESSSQFKGVYFSKKNNKWIANIKKNRTTFYLGSFDLEGDAASIYNIASQLLFGVFAKLNPL